MKAADIKVGGCYMLSVGPCNVTATVELIKTVVNKRTKKRKKIYTIRDTMSGETVDIDKASYFKGASGLAGLFKSVTPRKGATGLELLNEAFGKWMADEEKNAKAHEDSGIPAKMEAAGWDDDEFDLRQAYHKANKKETIEYVITSDDYEQDQYDFRLVSVYVGPYDSIEHNKYKRIMNGLPLDAAMAAVEILLGNKRRKPSK